MAAHESLQEVDHKGWLPGFNSLLGKENRSWWRTRKWWINLLVWTTVINGLLAMKRGEHEASSSPRAFDPPSWADWNQPACDCREAHSANGS